MTLNKDKCIFAATEIQFLGHIFSQNGMKLDNDKVNAIKNLKKPANKKELQRLLGMVNYLNKFIPNLSSITEPMRQLLSKNTEWMWMDSQRKSFETIKKVLSTAPVLKYYDVKQDVTLSVDASSFAIGACLLQNSQPVAYATKAFTKAQQNYPQIVKEALAIRFACLKFHQYIYGKKIFIETDHKPLEIIFKKPIHSAPLRLQRFMLDIIPYDPQIKYVKGSKLFIADTLSRDSQVNVEEDKEELDVQLVLAMSDEAKARFQQATLKEDELQELTKVIQRGWPHSIKDVDSSIKKYFNFREELSIYEGLIFKSNKVLVPSSEKTRIIADLHAGHPGVNTALRRARHSLYWYGLTTDITNFIEKCSTCQRTQRKNVKEPLINTEIPTLPFQIVGSDLFSFKSNNYIVIADKYSGFFDIQKLKSTNAYHIIKQLKHWFAIFGVPQTLITDNGTQYMSSEFRKFKNEWKFDHRTSSPKFPRSNGFAERYVQEAKKFLKRCSIDGSDVQLAFLHQRNTPKSENLPSPNERLMGRLTRTNLPITNEALKPKIIGNVHLELKKLQGIQKSYADRGSKPLKPLEIGEKVRLQVGHREWTGAEVIDKANTPRSYIVQTPHGQIYRRNSSHLHSTKANIIPPVEVQATLPTPTTETPIVNQPSTGDEGNSGTSSSSQRSTRTTNLVIRRQPTVTRYGRISKPIPRNP